MLEISVWRTDRGWEQIFTYVQSWPKTDVISVFLYGDKTWTVPQSDERKLEAFLWRILGVSWYDFVSNTVIAERTSQDSSLRRRRLAIFGHVRRLPETTSAHTDCPEAGHRHTFRTYTRQGNTVETTSLAATPLIGPTTTAWVKKMHHFISAMTLSNHALFWQFLARIYLSKFTITRIFHIFHKVENREPA